MKKSQLRGIPVRQPKAVHWMGVSYKNSFKIPTPNVRFSRCRKDLYIMSRVERGTKTTERSRDFGNQVNCRRTLFEGSQGETTFKHILSKATFFDQEKQFCSSTDWLPYVWLDPKRSQDRDKYWKNDRKVTAGSTVRNSGFLILQLADLQIESVL